MFKFVLPILTVILTTKSYAQTSLCQKIETENVTVENIDIENIKSSQIERILVSKKMRQLFLISKKGQILKSYNVVFGGNPEGHKVQEGDGRTPEGIYWVEYKNPRSKFHLSLKISYPNKKDKEKAQSLGVSPGGDIMIHGLPNRTEDRMQEALRVYAEASQSMGRDWTNGCVAVTNDEIEEIYSIIKENTLVEICSSL